MSSPTPDAAPTSAAPSTGRAARWLFALAVAVVSALALEGAARLVPPDANPLLLASPLDGNLNLGVRAFFREHPTLFWELVPFVREEPGYWGDVTNGEGLRMRAEVPPRDGRLRVVCLGDSCTYGLRVTADQAWPSVLAADRSLDVVNAGVPGYSSFQGARLAALRCPAWRPDVVVVEFGANDANVWPSMDRGRLVAPSDADRAAQIRLRATMRRSALVGWIQSLVGVAAPPTLREVPRGSFDGLPPRVSPAAFRENLAAIAAQAPHAIVLVWPRRRLLAPDAEDAVSAERYAPYVEAMLGLASDRVEVLDLRETVLRSGLSGDEAFLDAVHVTPAAHRIVAEAVDARLGALRGR